MTFEKNSPPTITFMHYNFFYMNTNKTVTDIKQYYENIKCRIYEQS